MAIKRVGLRMSEELKAWYEEKAEKTGIPFGNYMVMVLQQHRDGMIMADVMSKFGNTDELVKSIASNIEAGQNSK